jgi:FHS family L-fucose permease-like MFS transporter
LFILSAAPKTLDQIHQMSSDALQTYRVHEASSVKLPYIGLSLALVALAMVIAKFNLPTIPAVEHKAGSAPASSVLKYRHLVLGAVGIFTYVGAEVAIGSFLINYLTQPDIGNISPVKAATLVGFFYWGGAMAGRFIGSAILQKVRTGTVLGIAAIIACLLVLTTMVTTGHVAMWSIILVGFFNSIMFPSIFTLGIAELGPLTGDGSGVLVMAIVGGAIIPVLEGAMADRIGIHHAFILPAICYLYIMYYAFVGSKPRRPAAV